MSSRIRLSIAAVLALGFVLAITRHAAAADEPQLSGDDVLALVRNSQAQQYLQGLTGKLRNSESGESWPMELTMRDNVIRFLFRNPNEIINLDLNNNGSTLSRVISGGKVEVPMSLYSEHVRNTDINYEDLSMRFLYWRNAKIIGEDTMSFQKCWRVRVTNPDGRGPYGTVDVWVAKSSGAMMKMEAYNASEGRIVKRFEVRKGQKYKGAYILKQMRVQTFDGKGKETGVTYMEIDEPKE